MYSAFKKLPDLSYRSHKFQTDADTRSFESFDIRPAYLDRGPFLDPSKYVATPKSVRSGSTATAISVSSNTHNRTMTSSPSNCELSVNGVTGVTGIPNLVELDDTFNTLDPGQLLRESAAAATRAALLSEAPRVASAVPLAEYAPEKRRKSSSILVDDLLQQIYRQSSRSNEDDGDDNDEAFSNSVPELEVPASSSRDDSTNCAPGSHFSSMCSEPLKKKGTWELEVMRDHLRDALSRVTALLIQNLTQRDRLLVEREKNYDVITAILQAASPKRSQDTKMRFSIDPPINSSHSSTPTLSSPCSSSSLHQKSSQNQPDTGCRKPDSSGFQQWHDAMRMVARLPGGVPPEFRRKLWLTLAEQHLLRIGVDWSDVERNCFNDRINPDDEDLGAQIVRDLHRTGCSLFCGEDALPNQALLKRVLLAYARWNKTVGYCQGLNVLAALLLEVMNRSETESLKVMIYLIEGVLPTGYFANNLRGLSIDMAVFRDLLRQRLPALSRHLEMLQQSEFCTGSSPSSSSYCIEPPLTNVFTMQWFLTLFATCLPKAAVLRVWDLILLEGNDILLRTALAIWQTLAERILTVRTCDDFYSIMAVLAREMLEFGLMEPNHLVQTIVSMAPFPFPGLNELRDKYRYNITPWSGGSGRVRLFYSDDDPDGEVEEDEDEEKTKAMNAVATVFGGLMTSSTLFRTTSRRITDITFRKSSNPKHTSSPASSSSNEKEKLQLDIAALRKQYAKLRERQKQAHVMFWTVASSTSSNGREASSSDNPASAAFSSTSSGINPVTHLLAGRKPLLTRRPSTSSPPSSSSSTSLQQGPKLRLPPPRIPPLVGSTDGKAYFSAPTTPSDKSDNEPTFENVRTGQANPSKDPSKQRQQHQQQRRNSGCATSTPSNNIRQQYMATPSLSQSGTTASTRGLAITVNRSRLVQELLEQNSAMLLKLKDRPEVMTTSEPSSAVPIGGTSEAVVNEGNQQQQQPATSLVNSKGASPIHHNPFPRNLVRPPKDVTVKLGLYSSSQKF